MPLSGKAMPSTKRYYTVHELAELLRVPEHQLRRWIRLFLTLPPHKTLRVPAEALPLLRRVREGVYLYRLRSSELMSFVKGESPASPSAPWPDYPLLLQEILHAIDACIDTLDEPMPPLRDS